MNTAQIAKIVIMRLQASSRNLQSSQAGPDTERNNEHLEGSFESRVTGDRDDASDTDHSSESASDNKEHDNEAEVSTSALMLELVLKARRR